MSNQTGRALADEGMQLALFGQAEWVEEARNALARFLETCAEEHGPGHEFPMEQFRTWWQDTGSYIEPRSHKSWGAFTRSVAHEGLIKPTGQYVRATSPATRNHPVMLWRSGM